MFSSQLIRLICLPGILFLSACAGSTDQETVSNTSVSNDQVVVDEQPVVDGSTTDSGQDDVTPPVEYVDDIAPEVPGNLRLASPAEAFEVSLIWDESTDNVAVTGYRVFRNGVLLDSTASNNYIDSNVTAETAYQYQVEAYDAANNTATSNVLNVTTLAAPDVTAPIMSGDLNAIEVTSELVSFSWTAASDNVAVVGYRIYKDYSSVPYATTTSLSFTDTGLSPSQVYVYSVSAIDAAGNESLHTTDLSVETLAAATTQPVVLSWQTPTQNTDDSCISSIQAYQLSYGMSSTSYSTVLNLDADSGEISCSETGYDDSCGVSVMTCSHTINSLDAGTWYFAVQAVDSSGIISGYSNEISKLVN